MHGFSKPSPLAVRYLVRNMAAVEKIAEKIPPEGLQKRAVRCILLVERTGMGGRTMRIKELAKRSGVTKRNIHFYVNKCGFHIVEFFNSLHPDPRDPETGNAADFEKLV